MKAATKVFSAKGYRHAQMSDIAREMGVSQGTLYNYIESKEALFQLVCEQGFSKHALQPPQNPPIASVSFETMLQRIRESGTSNARLEALRTALRTKEPSDARAELEGVLREFYSVLERNRHGFDLVERSTSDVPELAQMLFVDGLKRTVDALARYITSRVRSGHFKPVPDAATAARFIIEAVTWFARHRHNSPDSQMISDRDARETTIHFLVSPLIAGESGQTKSPRRRKKARI
ncbi:MAG TPA: TetR/AcrR family transcriptional regulator [Candidatus Binataceae bacterium]|nr:TetR/AcrR family transcriptional regulator [Candidatus Binataceae bacterium]